MNFDLLETIEKTGSTIEKCNLLENFLKQEGAITFIKYAIDKNIVFGLKETGMFNAFEYDNTIGEKFFDIGSFLFQKGDFEEYSYSEMTEKSIIDIFEEIKNTSGNNQLTIFNLRMIQLKPIDRKWISRAINHDLCMGMSLKLVNQTFENLELVPVFKHDVQKAGSFDNWRDMKEFNKRISFPCIGEFKFDGFRCELRKRGDFVSLMSRRGKKIEYAPEIIEATKSLLSKYQNLVLDGELICLNDDNKKIDFNKIQQRSQRLHENIEPQNITFMAYDFLEFESRDFELFESQVKRTKKLKTFFDTEPNLHKTFLYEHINISDIISWSKEIQPFSRSQYRFLKSFDEVNEMYLEAIETGFEGLILKNLDGIYKRGDRKNWWKIKKSSKDNFEDATLKIIDVRYGTGKNKDMISSVLVIDHLGKVEAWISNMEESQMEECTKRFSGKKLIGSLCDVSYMEISKIHVPWRLRHPVFERFRFDREDYDDLSGE